MFKNINNNQNLWRDTDNKIISGVISGIAHYFGFHRNLTRLVAFILLLSMPFVVIVGYAVLVWLLPPRPEDLLQDEETLSRTQNLHRNPNHTVAGLKKRLQNLERKLIVMETKVTDQNFQLHQKFRDIS